VLEPACGNSRRLRPVLAALSEVGLLVVDGYVDVDPGGRTVV
jgi:hypothetical protein